MQYLGIEAALKNQPLLDPAFIPFGVWRREYEKEASRPFALALERDHGAVSVFETKLRGEDFAEANYRYIERFVKLLLWSAGGLRVWLCGDDALAKRLQAEYCPDGRRAFDVGFMQDVFEVPFEIVVCDWAHLPKPNEKPIRVGGHTNGCRIGFDAGGSDRKVSAVIDGQTVYSEEVVWHPKTSEDLSYQYDGIVSAFKTAASKLPRVDGIGVSAGYIDRNGDLLGWFNELAFAPVDLSETAAVDEWSGDRGVGCKYFSQDAVIKLAPAASIALDEEMTPAEKLKTVQALAEGGDERAKDIFRTIGAYLAHTVPLYEMTYDIRHLIVLGRVASGVGGELIVGECCRILREEYPALAQKVQVMLPDEKFRRVGQSMAAASLPEVPDAV